MSRVGGSVGIPVLVPGDLERPLKKSTQKIQNTLIGRSEHTKEMQICWCTA